MEHARDARHFIAVGVHSRNHGGQNLADGRRLHRDDARQVVVVKLRSEVVLIELASGFRQEGALQESRESPSRPAWAAPVLRDRAADIGWAEEARLSLPNRREPSAAPARYRSKDWDSAPARNRPAAADRDRSRPVRRHGSRPENNSAGHSTGAEYRDRRECRPSPGEARRLKNSAEPNVSTIFGQVSVARQRSSNPAVGRRRASSV